MTLGEKTGADYGSCTRRNEKRLVGDVPSISNMLEVILKLDGSPVTVHGERCVLVRNRNAGCLRCAEACASGCIHYDGTMVKLFPDKCIGCGTCATACPTCALEAHNPNDAHLLNCCLSASDAAGGVTCLACGQLLDQAHGLYDEEKVVRVECLGRVEESLLTSLAALRVMKIVLVRGECEACERVSGWGMAQKVCDAEIQLLRAWESVTDVLVVKKLPAAMRAAREDHDTCRRNALRKGGRDVARMGSAMTDAAFCDAFGDSRENEHAPCPVKVMGDGTLPHFLPDRRERLLDALACMGEPRDVMLDTRLWGRVVIHADRCTSCQMCATFCPTEALSKHQNEEGAFEVRHRSGDCVKCQCCVNICPTGALELSEEVNATDLLSGKIDCYPMDPSAVDRGGPHTIWNLMKSMTGTDQIYER